MAYSGWDYDDLFLLDEGNGTPAFSPSSIAGLQLWLDASDASTITLDGSNNVEQWLDKSGNAEHAVQASATLRPGVTTVNGLAAVLFDGVDDLMTGTELLTSDSDFTLFAVVKRIGGSASGSAYFIIGNDKSFGLTVGGDPPTESGYLNGGVAWRKDNVAAIDGTTYRQTLRRTGGTTYYTRSGGVTQSNAETPAATPYGFYHLGRQISVAQILAVCEVIFYTASLSTENQSLVNDYLNARWGTT